MNKCGITGHRPKKLIFGYNEKDHRCVKLKQELRRIIVDLIETENVNQFYSGMALGIDQYFAEIIINLKKIYPHIKLIAVLPCKEQDKLWNIRAKRRYQTILDNCDQIIYVNEKYSNDCMLIRDQFLVENIDIIIGVCNDRFSGTGYTLEYADSLGKEIIQCYPDFLKK